ncbi:aminopeptidase N [Aestuariibacter sp. AA17]|uniref:Aminopeptidase N n=1 Tax=Fluctibacter corallii TaxID=2984329 RepID=A0ABT3A639_9ALTE|nr:aminopeptidase N [Aestuariibacter sp. AA17]MCV2884142.1 aminopeptidase N [Aestuariibacter sp. AA17]
MSVTTHSVKRRRDYTPPHFHIDTVDLVFHLDDHRTRVESTLSVRKSNRHSHPLELDGVSLELISLHINDGSWTDYEVTPNGIRINNVPDSFTLSIETVIDPKNNTSLEGLYLSEGAFCTQCEAEGFRKITYFLDRPDVLSEYRVKIIGDASRFPYMLSNGNKVSEGQSADGTHWVEWHDPFKKPCYLFALVAGDFDLLEDTYTTKSGREVLLQLFVDKGKKERGHHALASLKRAMKWDEDVFGLEYDLDIYMIVAVDFFNMGAMENKGLNVFNSKYVLADAKSATDEDYFNIESVIAHEYFHNWTGNRVTCRDWFQLSLKEGLTVFRDQQFSADMASDISTRIGSVSVIREHQFAEDASAMSHPIRPDEVMEMNNFYTVTVYDKGAEVIRMMHTLLGAEGFRKGMDLYFERHDGKAVTCDDFVAAMEEANQTDLTVFKRWYSQSGTPKLTMVSSYDAQSQTLSLEFTQDNPPTADQKEKQPLHIPIRLELIDKLGASLPVNSKGEMTTVFNLMDRQGVIAFSPVENTVTPVVLTNFSAPVKLETNGSPKQFVHLAKYAKDGFARWDASQTLLSQYIHQQAGHDEFSKKDSVSLDMLDELFDDILSSAKQNQDLASELLCVPSFETLSQQVTQYNVDALYSVRETLLDHLANTHQSAWLRLYEEISLPEYTYEQAQVHARKLKNLALTYASLSQRSASLPTAHFNQADNMTDTLSALKAAQTSNVHEFDKLMERFEATWRDDPLVLDKWFGLHASTSRDDILSRLDLLSAHKQFSKSNPNRVRALVGSFAFYNPKRFHSLEGSGYKYVTDYLLELDDINPQVAARIITPLTQWQHVDVQRQSQMKHQLMRIANKVNLSKDLTEKVTKSLSYSLNK